jgi:ubiquinone biosynthesis protein
MISSAASHEASAESSKGAAALEVGEQIRAWLRVIDAVLMAVEDTAWQAREIGSRTREAWLGVHGTLEKLAASSRALASEISAWPDRLTRLTTTGFALTRIATGYRLHTTKAAFMPVQRAAKALDMLHEQSAQRLYELSARHGGAFLKVGQMLSARPDLLPDAYVRELSKLQDAAPGVPFERVKAVLEAELGGALEGHFASFDEAPLASASIGQVHRATLPDGREVAVKVQRPGVDEMVALDLELLEMFARALAQNLPPVDLDTIVRQVRTHVTLELDYAREAELTERVCTYFGDESPIRAPRVVCELSTRRVLVTELMAGEKITNVLDRLLAARNAGDETAQPLISRLLGRVLEAYARQVLELGVFQADPHPGNLLANDGGELVLLDFGCSEELDEQRRLGWINLARAFVSKDVPDMAKHMEALGFEADSASRAGLEAYAKLVVEEMGLVRERGGDWPNQVEMLAQFASVARRIEDDPITKLPDEAVMLGRVFGTLAGLFLHYRPDTSAATSVLPILLFALSRAPIDA